jgi:hypothetical protein
MAVAFRVAVTHAFMIIVLAKAQLRAPPQLWIIVSALVVPFTQHLEPVPVLAKVLMAMASLMEAIVFLMVVRDRL